MMQADQPGQHLPQKQLLDSIEFVEWLRGANIERRFPANSRTRSSGACFAIALQHHHSIVLLIEHELLASSFSLLRLEFEAYVRGQWLLLCATNDQIEDYLRGSKPPDFSSLVRSLEKTPSFPSGYLERIKCDAWKTMCAYTHTGGLQVQRWNTHEAIESNYSEQEVAEVLNLADIFGALSLLGVAELTKDVELASRINAQILARVKRET